MPERGESCLLSQLFSKAAGAGGGRQLVAGRVSWVPDLLPSASTAGRAETRNFPGHRVKPGLASRLGMSPAQGITHTRRGRALPVLRSIPQPCSACCLRSCSSAKFPAARGPSGDQGHPPGPGGSGNLLVALLNSPGCQLAPCGQRLRPRDNLGTLQGQLRDNSGTTQGFAFGSAPWGHLSLPLSGAAPRGQGCQHPMAVRSLGTPVTAPRSRRGLSHRTWETSVPAAGSAGVP